MESEHERSVHLVQNLQLTAEELSRKMVSQESEFKSILDQQELEFNKRV